MRQNNRLEFRLECLKPIDIIAQSAILLSYQTARRMEAKEMTTKILDLSHKSTPIEVVCYATSNNDEKPDIWAKGVRDYKLALVIANWIADNVAGYIEIILR